MPEIKEWTDLKENIETTIYEGLLKLGYKEDESFSIYYDLDLLNHLLHTEYKNIMDMNDYLIHISEYIISYIPTFSYSLANSRFKFTVLKEGIMAIKEHNRNHTFLKELIDLVNTHNFTIQDVLSVFKKVTDDFICEETRHPEFQYVIYFKNKALDKFKYCFSFDELGAYYHRLLDFSYEQTLKEDHNH